MSDLSSGTLKKTGGADKYYIEIGGKAKVSIDFAQAGFLEYQMKMLEYGRPAIFLDMERMAVAGGYRVFYDCHGFLTLEGLLCRGPFNVFRVLYGLGEALLQSEDYLIHSTCISLEPEWIYVDPETLAVRLMFLPDGSGSRDVCGAMESIIRRAACKDGFGYFYLFAETLSHELKDRSRGLRSFCNAVTDAERQFIRREQGLDAVLQAIPPAKAVPVLPQQKADQVRETAVKFLRLFQRKNLGFILCQAAMASAALKILSDSGFEPADKAVYVLLAGFADFLLVRSFNLYKPGNNQ